MNKHDQIENPSAEGHEADSLLAAFALGALDLDEQAELEALLATSPAHQKELRQLREVAALLPYATLAAEPPAHVKTQLFARVEADRATRLQAPAPSAAAPRVGRHMRRWMLPGFAVVLAVIVFALGNLTLMLSSTVRRLDEANRELTTAIAELQQSLTETQARQETLSGQLAASQDQWLAISDQWLASEDRIGQLNARLAYDQQIVTFVSAPGVATRELVPARPDASARGEMYMYPGEPNAVVLFSGLPTLETGEVYQFWLADGSSEVAAGTFQVDHTGIARLVVQAPREVNAFQRVMVTIEPDGGSATPGTTVVLAGSL
ncbi:anti-sigma factor [Candidatus Chloroploca sp. M-50]|uniref:Regulator of SigK n=1 Tax=Candidatus Chloroploca mongolica TaxID=2528176 RepID=A0ABS4D520_9CHLR|nr:anti-sigma factor [Candidatus Chloroploca mongolica]MBP1464534.1 anti-sigma factor [Candidatus Chloroploca mongolica]